MEREVIEAYSESVRKEIFEAVGVNADGLDDLEGFENFVYGDGGRVIRITHNSHRTKEQLLGELEFLEYLHSGGAAVSKPIPFAGSRQLVTVGDFHVCQFVRAAGLGPPMDEAFPAEVIAQWGKCIGQFHKLARNFEPEHPRQNWETDENHRFAARIPDDQPLVLARAAALMDKLSTFNQSPTRFGLIHSDAHARNYVNDRGRLTFFDFDDCLYAWYGYDIATILLGVAIQPWVDNSQDAMADAVARFLPVFMEGYCRENDSACLMWDHMHDFLKLRELSLYAVIHAHMDPAQPEGWLSAKFMRNRRTRIEQNLPYVDLDFSTF